MKTWMLSLLTAILLVGCVENNPQPQSSNDDWDTVDTVQVAFKSRNQLDSLRQMYPQGKEVYVRQGNSNNFLMYYMLFNAMNSNNRTYRSPRYFSNPYEYHRYYTDHSTQIYHIQPQVNSKGRYTDIYKPYTPNRKSNSLFGGIRQSTRTSYGTTNTSISRKSSTPNSVSKSTPRISSGGRRGR